MAARTGAALAAVAVAVALAGCSLEIPADPHGTLDRVEGGLLRVGVTDNPPWTETHDGAEPTGTEVDLVEAFAERHDARVEFVDGSEATLVTALEHGDLDLLIGGFTDSAPWTDRAAMTVPYAEEPNAYGDLEKHVMIVRMGENRFMYELERFLLAEGVTP